MKNKMLGYLGFAMAMAMMSKNDHYPSTEESVTYRDKLPKEPVPQKGQFHYWFREDGSFLNEKQDERMRKDECVFVCFSINDRNAIKKFNAFLSSK